MERIDVERLAERGIYVDPFDSGPLNRRGRYTIAEVAELPSGFEPFRVTVVEPEETIQWSEADQIAAARFAKARPSVLDASLDATNFWLQARDPFRVSVNG